MGVSAAIFNFADMRFVGNLQANQPINDASGGQSDNYVTVLTTRCFLQKLTGSDGFPSGTSEYIKTYKLICRSQTAIGALVNGMWVWNINPDSRWVINGEQYDIDDFDRIDMVPHFIQMHLTKNQP